MVDGSSALYNAQILILGAESRKHEGRKIIAQVLDEWKKRRKDDKGDGFLRMGSGQDRSVSVASYVEILDRHPKRNTKC